MKSLRFKRATLPLAMFVLALLAYGLLLPWLGFYWDDWPFAWIANFLGSGEFIEAFRPFRPFLGPIFLATTGLLPETPLAWQALGLVVRLAVALAAWWSFDQVWPDHYRENFFTALFFLLFPGFSQQWIAFTHTNQALFSLLGFVLSLGVTARAYRSRKDTRRFWLLTAGALALEAWGLFTTEYFFGLEGLRLLILFFLVGEEEHEFGRRTWRALLLWLPYLGVWIANAIWLVVYYRSGAYDSYGLKAFAFQASSALEVLTGVAQAVVGAIAVAGFSAWAQTLAVFSSDFSTTTTLLTLGLVGLSFLFTYGYLRRVDFGESGSARSAEPWAIQALILGTAGILLGRLPSWAASLPLSLDFSWDRFMLSMMLGGSFMFVGLLEYLVRADYRKTMVFSLAIALAVGQQFTNANSYRRDWNNQRTFFWQLAWRVPALKPGTLLVTHDLPLTYETDYSLTAPLNWIYAPNFSGRTLPYMVAYTRARLGTALLPSFGPGVEIRYPYRTTTFEGSTDQMLVIYQPSPGCLRVMDPLYASADTAPGASYMLTDAIPLSNLSRIEPGKNQPQLPADLFGAEPAHTWCYYFEQAELARQAGNWEEAARLGEEAQQSGFSAEAQAEWLVFIEASVRQGKEQAASSLSRQVLEHEPDLGPALCRLWERVESETGTLNQSTLAELRSSLNCSP